MFLLSFLSWSDLLVGLAILSVSLFVYQFYIAPSSTSYANLPGPPLDSYLWGNMQRLVKCVPFYSGAGAARPRRIPLDLLRRSPRDPRY